MDKRFKRTVDFLNAVRFGMSIAEDAQRVEYKGGDAIGKLFETARPMLASPRR